MIIDGPYFTSTLDALGLQGAQRTDTVHNASDIVSAVATAYGGAPDADLNQAAVPNSPVAGLVYGRIQSGKTRAMIASMASLRISI